ncbi:hypothetical protein JW905_09265 [bacterium]|nr:hypothetical protein [candidate division CSSED10-310 bacterium]
MLEVLERDSPIRLGLDLPGLMPIFPIDDEAMQEAMNELNEKRQWINGRKMVWMTVRSTTDNRNPPHELWIEFAERLEKSVAFVELLAPNESPMDSDSVGFLKLSTGAMGAFMQIADAGVAVDTFGLHLAAAVGARKVVAVLGSSDPRCVCYPGNDWVYKISDQTKVCQPCGNHGYNDEQEILGTMDRDDLRIQRKQVHFRRYLVPAKHRMRGYPGETLPLHRVTRQVDFVIGRSSLQINSIASGMWHAEGILRWRWCTDHPSKVICNCVRRVGTHPRLAQILNEAMCWLVLFEG